MDSYPFEKTSAISRVEKEPAIAPLIIAQKRIFDALRSFFIDGFIYYYFYYFNYTTKYQ